jgi:hypothetical protein
VFLDFALPKISLALSDMFSEISGHRSAVRAAIAIYVVAQFLCEPV